MKEVSAFKCLHCDELHEDYESAEDCCGPHHQDAGTAYVCEKCGELHEFVEDAEECCK